MVKVPGEDGDKATSQLGDDVGAALEPEVAVEAAAGDEAMEFAEGSRESASFACVQAPREDADVEEAMGAGDARRATTLLMARYGDRVYQFARTMTRNDDLAEEIRQQVFIQAYRDLASFAGRGSVRSWLFTIVRHRCLDALKTQRRWNWRFKNDTPPEAELADHDPDRGLDQTRLALIVATCLAKLTPAAREAVLLRFHQDLSYDEASEVSGARPGTIQQRVARALEALHRCIAVQLRAGAS